MKIIIFKPLLPIIKGRFYTYYLVLILIFLPLSYSCFPNDNLPCLAVLIQPVAAVAAAAVGAAAAPIAAVRPRPPNLEAANHQGLIKSFQ